MPSAPASGKVPLVAERIIPPNFAIPAGPWTPAVKVPAGEMLFIAGCISIDENGEVVAPGDVAAQPTRS